MRRGEGGIFVTITQFSASTFWKGETGVKAQVSEGGHAYRASLYLKNGQVFDYSCTCDRGRSYKGMCPHCEALLQYHRQQSRKESGRPVFTSQEVRGMIREYTNREVADILREEEGADVSLRPRLLMGGGGLQLEAEVGRERFYVVKDLSAFAEAVDGGLMVRYGKQFGFHHSLSAFTEESRPLAQFLLDLVHTYRDYYAQFHHTGLTAVPAFRSIRLNKGDLDRFFGLVMGKVLETEDGRGQRNRLFVTEGSPRITARVERSGRDGISISLPDSLIYLKGEQAIYVGDGERICRCDGEMSRELSFFLDGIAGPGGRRTLEVNDRDLPLFYSRVIKKLESCVVFQSEDVKLEDYQPQELTAKFVFDSPEAGKVVLHPTLSYGDYSFHPVEDEHVPRTVCRDVPGEFRISQAITRYFKYREEGSGDPVIRDDEEALYRLLTEGMGEFKRLGEVEISREMGRLKILPPPAVSVGVSCAGNWLDLTVEADGLSRQELLKVLDSYRQKKKYYRLKSGEFLRLQDDGLMTVASMLDGLGLTKAQMAEDVMRIPGYRAFYLDSILEARRGMTVYRDRMFKAVVRGMKALEDSDFEVPETLNGELREYQKLGFKWMKTLDLSGFGGILADDMGLGKTVQVIALLLDEQKSGGGQPSLIVCPASLVYNWENEIRKFGPSLKSLLVTGGAAERKAALKQAGEYDVVITSYDLLRRDLELYGGLEFRYEIIDEAQYIKNAGTLSAKAVKAVKARSRFALTGTPIENRLGELWSIFDYLMPGFLFSYQKFRREYEVPAARDGDREALSRLHRLTGPFILRRLKGEVLKELPEKLETVIYSRAEGAQRELYNANAALLKEKLEEGGFEREKFQVLADLTRLRQICCHPSLCYSHYKEGSAKLETCVDLIRDGVGGGHRILLFSQFTSMLDLLGERLAKEKIPFYRLTGETPKEERVRLAGLFGQDEVSVFLISLKAGGTGLNLTAADMVIHYDPWWNVAAQNQATDRAYRIGQEKKVTVFKLIMKDTVEENILRLQEMKQSLAEGVIAPGTIELASLTGRDVLRLLEG